MVDENIEKMLVQPTHIQDAMDIVHFNVLFAHLSHRTAQLHDYEKVCGMEGAGGIPQAKSLKTHTRKLKAFNPAPAAVHNMEGASSQFVDEDGGRGIEADESADAATGAATCAGTGADAAAAAGDGSTQASPGKLKQKAKGKAK